MAGKKKAGRPANPSASRALEEPLFGGQPLRRFHWSYSGRYHTGNTKLLRKKSLTTASAATMHAPSRMNEAHYLPENMIGPADSLSFRKRLVIQLRIDIDQEDPLHVVSGTVSELMFFPYFRPPQNFIGKVVKNATDDKGLSLLVEEFTFSWPGTNELIDRLVIKLTPPMPSLTRPTAEATFITTGRREKGPYKLERSSRYFRDVEVEVDYEDSAVNPEPYNTHTHPDRPADMENYDMTFESAYRRSGINMTRPAGGTNLIDSSEAGDLKWNTTELHDAMETHWTEFANRPQWKLWVFMAEQANADDLAGIMFDAYLDEPGGVDRQGTAVFTKCKDLNEKFPPQNPPGSEAMSRELFALMVHEAGHAFNLFHPWQKTNRTPWSPPPWMPLTNRDLALTWMNYSFRASYIADDVEWLNSKWFYDHFDFRFDDMDNLFLRHAPDRFVIMGGSNWGINHGLILESMRDHRLELLLRSRKAAFELGEPVTIELRLKNRSKDTITLNNDFDLHSGRLELAITDPKGNRTPFLPFISQDVIPKPVTLVPKEAIYLPVNLAIGIGGCPFKEPGNYRIDAGFQSANGIATAGSMGMRIRPLASPTDGPVIQELFNARVGRILYLGGSRVMEDAIDRMQWVAKNLGKKHPAQFQIARAVSSAYMHPTKQVDVQKKKIKLRESDPDRVAVKMKPIIDEPDAAADSIGHIAYTRLVNDYADCTVHLPKKGQAARALREMLEMFQKRKVIKSVIDDTKDKLEKIE